MLMTVPRLTAFQILNKRCDVLSEKVFESYAPYRLYVKTRTKGVISNIEIYASNTESDRKYATDNDSGFIRIT